MSGDLRHIGIIMDGNGRWASARSLPRTAGHLAGLKALRKASLGAIRYHIPYLTLYCFSTENWKRPHDEVNYLMGLFASKIHGELSFYRANGIQIKLLGDISRLPEEAQKGIQKTIDDTSSFTSLTIQLAINYGGQDEICRAANKAIAEGCTVLTPEIIRSHFDNPDIPPVDIIARSAGELRLSGFLLFDSAYAEFVFYDKLWPNWDEDMIGTIVSDYNTRVRRYGGLSK